MMIQSPRISILIIALLVFRNLVSIKQESSKLFIITRKAASIPSSKQTSPPTLSSTKRLSPREAEKASVPNRTSPTTLSPTKRLIPREAAIAKYRAKVEASSGRCKHSNTKVNMDLALSCLRKTNEKLELEYPQDAEAHFNEIRLVMAEFAQHDAHGMHRAAGYRGPWIENHWIHHFEGLYDNNRTDDLCLSDIFGPFIPLFVPWTDHWVQGNGTKRYRYPNDLLTKLRTVLRSNVPYITVSQNDEGLTGKNEIAMKEIPNVLVLSAGGYGHIPIPLLKQVEDVNNNKDVTDRSLLVSYVGSLTHSPNGARKNMNITLTEEAKTWHYKYTYYYGNNWRNVMADSRFSLVPRGFGRTAYHLVETLQMGLIPIYVHLGVSWVPYAALFHKIAFMTTFEDVGGLIRRLQNITIKEIREREQHILSLIESHFSFAGILSQIERFLKGKKMDLRCQKLPDEVRLG